MFVSPIGKVSPNFGFAMRSEDSVRRAFQEDLEKAGLNEKVANRTKKQREIKVALDKRTPASDLGMVDIKTNIVQSLDPDSNDVFIRGEVIDIETRMPKMMGEGDEAQPIMIDHKINPKKSLQWNFNKYLKQVDSWLKGFQAERNNANAQRSSVELPVLGKDATQKELQTYLNA